MRRALLLVVASAHTAGAQLLTDNGAAITIQPGTQVTVQGTLLANPGATCTNNGLIDLSGDLTNNSGNALFGASQGTVIMNGMAQSVGGTSITAFDDLDLQCTTLTLQQDALVGGTNPSPSGVLAVNNAIVQLNANRLVVNNAGAGAITRINGQLVSESVPLSGYGEVEWRIGTSAGVYVVPFGTGSVYLPVTLDITSAGSGAGSFILSTYPTDPFATPNNRPLPAGLNALTDAIGFENAPNVVDRYWLIADVGYTTAPTAGLTFTYRDAEWSVGTNTIVEATLQAQHFDGVQWSQPPSGVANTVGNTVTTASTTSFGLVWALTQGFAALPIELLGFTAVPEGSVVQCAWTTASESNNDYFTVERSADGWLFTDVGEVDGAGTSQGERHYAFPDPSPLTGLSYYRLRQTDFDGTEQRSNIVAVWRGATGEAITLYPNPCSDVLFINGTVGAGAPMRIMDATGRVVMRIPQQRSGGVDVSTLPAGAYVLVFYGGADERAARFVKH
ncbi:MAG: T9SS type A sorting domain-containing protein [Flavobacteriales bacterium]